MDRLRLLTDDRPAGSADSRAAASPPSYAAGRSASGDEWFDPQGRVRTAVAPLARALFAMSQDARERLVWNLRLRVEDAGITYHVYQDPTGSRRAWPLDALPAVLDGDEWATIAAGVAQRAALLDAVLNDLYGPRTLLREGFVPPGFVYRHHAWLAPVARQAGDAASDFPRLWFYAADLARGPDGRFWVMGDRTQAPSGAAYADQNRSVTRALWPQGADVLRPQPLDGGFSDWALGIRAALATLPDAPPDACAVLLSPGPLNESWFEHVHLAQRLNLQLVQGEDLVFHDGRIWLRGLERLVPVGVILRRVDDDWSDPLFLRPDSVLGVAGLLEAERRGRVRVLNGLGSGLLESPGWQAFLPRIAAEWWGEPLALPGVASWWCGDETARAFVLDAFERLVIRRIDRAGGGEPVFAAQLSALERERLIAEIRAAPDRFVAQEALSLSTFPTLTTDGGLEPRHGTLRVFAGRRAGAEGYAASARSGALAPRERSVWRVLPTALTRVAGRADSIVVSNQAGGLSKDTWVCLDLHGGRAAQGDVTATPGPTGPDTVARRDETTAAAAAAVAAGQQRAEPSAASPSGDQPAGPRGVAPADETGVPRWTNAAPNDPILPEQDNLPRRVAERFYWLGRYAERLESVVRWSRLLRYRVERLPPGVWTASDAAESPELAPGALREASSEAAAERAIAAVDTVATRGLAPMLDALAWMAGWALPAADDPAAEAVAGPALRLQAQLMAVFGPWGRTVMHDLLERIEGNHHALRDRLSGDTLHVLQRLHEHVGRLAAILVPAPDDACSEGWQEPAGRASSAGSWVRGSSAPHRDALDPTRLFRIERALASVAESLAAFAGLSHENLVHHHGWRFLDAGRRIERARTLLRLLSLTLPVERTSAPDGSGRFESSADEDALHGRLMREAVVRFAESVAAVRPALRVERRGPRAPDGAADGERDKALEYGWVDRLLRDPDNPRGLLFQIERLVEHARAWPGRRGSLVGWSALETEAELIRVRLRAGAATAAGAEETVGACLAEVDRLHAVLETQFLAPVPTQVVSSPLEVPP